MAILRQYHPDKNQDMPQDVANQKFREISEAFGFLWVKFMGFLSRNPPVMFMGISPKQLVVLHPWKLTVMEPPKKCGLGRCVSFSEIRGDFFVFQVLGLSFSWGGSVVRVGESVLFYARMCWVWLVLLMLHSCVATTGGCLGIERNVTLKVWVLWKFDWGPPEKLQW